MRNCLLFPTLLLCSLPLLCRAQGGQTSQPPGLEDVKDSAQQKRLIHYWADYSCFSLSDHSEPNAKEQCKEACFPGGVKSDVPAGKFITSSQTCWVNGPETDYRTGKALTEEQKKENPRTVKTITTGYCICDDPIVNVLGDFFIKSTFEAGKILQKVMCPALMALDLVVEIGSAAIPGVGKAITVGMRTGVKTAKMFQHAYDAEEAAMEWASMFVDQGFGLASEAGCKTPFTFSKANLAKRFLDFADAPDELVPGINYDELPCPKVKKASKKCREKNGEKDSDSSPSKTRNNDQSTQTHTQLSSTVPSQVASSASSIKATASADCAAIGRRESELWFEENAEANEDCISKRFLGSTLHKRRLEVRDLKTGLVCKKLAKTDLSSKNYPSSGAAVMKTAVAYGFNKIDDCSDYAWGEQKTRNEADYNTEHILEWSVVRTFFTKLNDDPDFKDGFTHPDPEYKTKDKKVNFCTYWKQSWDWPIGTIDKDFPAKLMTNPNPAFVSSPTGIAAVEQTPFGWFAEAYPYMDGERKAYEDEFILLQTRINQHAKNRMFAPNWKERIFADSSTQKLVLRTNQEKRTKGRGLKYPDAYEQPRIVIQRMRGTIGAFLYLKETKVNGFFIAQVNRIGAQLELLEAALAKQPREVVRRDPPDAQGVKLSRYVVFHPWQPQKLRDRWIKYMDEVYRVANTKGQEFMTNTLRQLDQEYNDGKLIEQTAIDKEKDKKEKENLEKEKKLREDMKDYIAIVKTQWAQANSWPKPRWGP